MAPAFGELFGKTPATAVDFGLTGLKGRNVIAQGEALGNVPTNGQALKGRHNFS